MRRPAMSLLAVLVLIGGLGACAETDDPDAGDPPAPTSTEGDADPQDDGDGPRATVRYSGAESGEITDVGSCSGGPSGEGLQMLTSAYDEDTGVTWMLQISIPAYDGPGEYDVGESLTAGDTVSFDDTSVTLANNDGGSWGSTAQDGGSVTVDAAGDAGSVDTTLQAEGGGSELQVSGAWSCTAS